MSQGFGDDADERRLWASHRWYEVYLQEADAGRLPDFALVKEIELPSRWWEGSLNAKPT